MPRSNHREELIESLEPRKLLATFVVTSADDAGAGTLRQAVLDANAQAGADTIFFDPALAGTEIDLTSGFIPVSDALTLRGTDTNGTRLGISVSGGFASSHFFVSGGTDFAVTMSDLRLVRGAADRGGSIVNGESLTLERMRFVSNLANSGDAEGGAIANFGALVVRDSYFSGNIASNNGGAIVNYGSNSGATVTVTNSTFFGNVSGGAGGAMFQQGRGLSADLTIRNSTFVSNVADSDNSQGPNENGGAIHVFSTGTWSLTSTILSSNRLGNNDRDEISRGDNFATLTSAQNNLIENAATSGGITNGVNGNIVGVDPMLAGGPVSAGGPTPIFPLMPGSPAIDAGRNPEGLTNDQRGVGFARANGVIDIGAFEVQTISIVVNSGEDVQVPPIGDAIITLREALEITNNNPGADAITFDSSLSGKVITLTAGQLSISDDLLMTGPGRDNLTINGDARSRVLFIDDSDYSTNRTVAISGLAIANGQDDLGGGIYTEDDLVLTNVNVLGNAAVGVASSGGGIHVGRKSRDASGIGADLRLTDSSVLLNSSEHLAGGLSFSGGNLTITGSTIAGNTSTSLGGGLVWGGANDLSLTRSRVSNNTSGASGGGLQLQSGTSATITDSIIADNSAAARGGGIATESLSPPLQLSGSTVEDNGAGGAGGGLSLMSAATVTNSTVSGNTAGAGGAGVSFSSAGTLAVANSTVAFNADTAALGGGIRAESGTLVLTSSIVANNTDRESGGTVPSDIKLSGGAVTADSVNNLIGDIPTSGGLTNGTHGNIVGQDPRLAPLAENGGTTRTHALLPGSPAIDAGSAQTNLTLDQRGGVFVRSSGDAPDIGAYERQALSLVVDTTASDDDGNLSAGNLSIREAILAANANPVDDEIRFDDSLAGQTITLLGVPLVISDDLAIVGLGADQLTIDGGGASRIIFVSDGSSASITVSISGLTLANGASSGSGGAISNLEDLTLDRVVLDANTAAGDGGALHNTGALTITNSTITSNSAGDSAGAIDNDGAGVIVIDATTITGNTAAGSAGAIDNDAEGTLTISNSVISGNTTGANGGAIDNAGELTITGSTLADNASTDSGNGFGGAIQNQPGGVLTVSGSTISGNSGVSSGGGIENNGTATITESAISGNAAADAGGGIDNFGGVLTVTRSTLSGNSAGGSGGAIFTDTELTIVSSTISGNTAGDFGGGIGMLDGVVTITNSTVAFNTADANDDGFGQGGGIDVGRQAGQGVLTADSTIFANNTLGAADPAPNDITLTNGGTVAGGNNLVQDGTTAGGLTAGQNGNLVGVDARLSALADNGGPTLTHAIFPGSPAVDAGSASGSVATDQRGLDRVRGNAADIGAFEWAPTSNFAVNALDGAVAAMTSTTDDTQFSVARNADGDVIVLSGSVSTWTVLRLNDYVAAPAVTADPITWTDPNDGRVYVAAPSADGFLLFRRDVDGSWTFRDLAAETSNAADAPVGTLTYFVSRPRTGAPLIYIAGFNGAGEIVLYQQTAPASAGNEPGWELYNVSDDLASQAGMATPAFSSMTSYVTSWNQWTLAGLDADGNVQGVWVNVATFTTWRVDNLSALTGADPLTGELDVTLTTWGGIRFAGADAGGQLVATWWNPALGAGNWKQTDLTDAVPGGAPRLVGGQLTAWFAPGNLISYAGYDADGDVTSFYWQPSDGGNWNSDDLTGSLNNRVDRPVGRITSHVSGSGEMSIAGVASDQSVIRLWRASAEDEFRLDNLSDLAIRV